MTPQAEKLKALLKVANDGLSKVDFEKAFKSVVNLVLKIEKQLIGKINTLLKQAIDSLKSETEALKKATQDDFSDFSSKYSKSIDKALKEQENGLNFLRDKAMRIKDFKNGNDGYSPVKGVDYFDGE